MIQNLFLCLSWRDVSCSRTVSGAADAPNSDHQRLQAGSGGHAGNSEGNQVDSDYGISVYIYVCFNQIDSLIFLSDTIHLNVCNGFLYSSFHPIFTNGITISLSVVYT